MHTCARLCTNCNSFMHACTKENTQTHGLLCIQVRRLTAVAKLLTNERENECSQSGREERRIRERERENKREETQPRGSLRGRQHSCQIQTWEPLEKRKKKHPGRHTCVVCVSVTAYRGICSTCKAGMKLQADVCALKCLS